MDHLFKLIISFFFDLKKILILNKKISRIYKSISSPIVLSKEKLKAHKKLWSKIGSKPNVKWYKVYASINQIDDPNYITEVDYYNKIEPTLNNRAFSEAYCEKNFYHKYLNERLLPNIYIRNIEGVFYDQAYKRISSIDEIGKYFPWAIEKLIVKIAVDSGGGKSVELFTKMGQGWKNGGGKILSKEYLERFYKKNYLVQEYIQQHSYYSQFNISSVNTVRLFTYRSVKTNEIIPLQAVLRIGRPGANVDNQAAGGVACGIKSNGQLNCFCVNKKGEKLYNINGMAFDKVAPVYKYNEIAALGVNLADMYHYHRLLGFDFCVNQKGEIVIIEINNRNLEINFLQMNNGPLFREYTEEILEFCSIHNRTICLDFEIK